MLKPSTVYMQRCGVDSRITFAIERKYSISFINIDSFWVTSSTVLTISVSVV